MSLVGKTAFISGGSRSLGLAIAKVLSMAGVKVAISGRHAKTLETACQEMGQGALALPMNVRDPSSVRDGFARIEREFGTLSILINNAATGYFHRIENAEDAALAAEVETNFFGPLYCIRSAIPLMRKAGGGDIISITSESIAMPFPGLTVYAATKSAVETLSRGLRDELKPDNIRISVLRCGRMSDSGSGLFDHWTDAQRGDAFALWTKTGHMAMVGESMRAETAARAIINALTLPRDGGMDVFEVRGR
jgi:meso-butanediol dehydrogenase / (S,S)-butanediol dehydrogenase / diacetyl reductase